MECEMSPTREQKKYIFGELNYKYSGGKENNYGQPICMNYKSCRRYAALLCSLTYVNRVVHVEDDNLIFIYEYVKRRAMIPNIQPPHKQLLSSCLSYGGGGLACAHVTRAQTPEVCDKCSTVTPVIR